MAKYEIIWKHIQFGHFYICKGYINILLASCSYNEIFHRGDIVFSLRLLASFLPTLTDCSVYQMCKGVRFCRLETLTTQTVNALVPFYSVSYRPVFYVVHLSCLHNNLLALMFLNTFISCTLVWCFVFIVSLFVSTDYVNTGPITILYILIFVSCLWCLLC